MVVLVLVVLLLALLLRVLLLVLAAASVVVLAVSSSSSKYSYLYLQFKTLRVVVVVVAVVIVIFYLTGSKEAGCLCYDPGSSRGLFLSAGCPGQPSPFFATGTRPRGLAEPSLQLHWQSGLEGW